MSQRKSGTHSITVGQPIASHGLRDSGLEVRPGRSRLVQTLKCSGVWNHPRLPERLPIKTVLTPATLTWKSLPDLHRFLDHFWGSWARECFLEVRAAQVVMEIYVWACYSGQMAHEVIIGVDFYPSYSNHWNHTVLESPQMHQWIVPGVSHETLS